MAWSNTNDAIDRCIMCTQRQQKKVAEENSLYFGILQKALPPPPPDETKATDDAQQHGNIDELSNNVSNHVPATTSVSTDRPHHGKSVHKASPKPSSSLSSGSSSSSGGGGGASGSGSSSSSGGSSSGRSSQKAQSSSGNRHRPSSGLKLHEGNRERSSSVSRQNQQQSSLATPSSPVATEQPTTPTSPVSPASTTPSTVAGINNAITSSAPPPSATTIANGDIPLVDGAAQVPAQVIPTGVGGGMSISGKKQATVRAVPRVDQPATTAQEKVNGEKILL